MPKKEINYNVLSAELDKVLVKLQDPATSLDKAIELFKRGQAIIKELETYLSQAENVIRTLSRERPKTDQ
ncbi:MAG TPA: exodeoxyribonuclease VII small subunit [Candidatus Saccharimonadales bacterium]|jgi:exodeoxyribonuclease VII small subunit|nr:exodeoxyribonuclease VII small subunit [Candidatus Saccharimonadales bacterium]